MPFREDIRELLSGLKVRHPEIRAVSCKRAPARMPRTEAHHLSPKDRAAVAESAKGQDQQRARRR